MSRQTIDRLREVMRREGLDAVLVVTDDFHGSEYVGEYFREREYLTGFTGSAGTAVVTADKALLWTDGRYFLQAADQLAGSGIQLMKSGEPDVPTPAAWLLENVKEGQVLGFDGRTVAASFAEALVGELRRRQARVRADIDPVGEIWEERPPLSAKPAYLLDTDLVDESREQKLATVRGLLDEAEADCLVTTSLDDIMWLLNIRGADIPCNPVLLSYLYLDGGQCWLFCHPDAFGELDRIVLQTAGVTLAPYEQIYQIVPQLTDLTIWLDPAKVNYALTSLLPHSAKRLEKSSPMAALKAVKNETEVAHMKQAHVTDGVAVTRFVYWLKTQAVAEGATEVSAAEKLERLRLQHPDYREPSFDSIVAYADHGAIVHYSATEETDRPLEDTGFVLCDVGGQYRGGTTDVTRTVALGALSEQQKTDYTDVLRGHLRLAMATFREGMDGKQLDILARQPLWDRGLDYNHGTGHGVGYMLNVHEGPNAFRWKGECAAQQAGMITSDEPGLYRAGEYGIRIENLILCKQATTAGYLCFEHLTMAPYDRSAILPERLLADEREALNAYHAQVYATLSPLLSAEEAAWLKEETAPF